MTPVAMAMNFGTKIDYNSAPVKNNCALFLPTLPFSGPCYLMVSFKFLNYQNNFGKKLTTILPL